MPSAVHPAGRNNKVHPHPARSAAASVPSSQESSAQLSRPHRQSIFNNPGWPPAPECAPPTPSGLRLARAACADHLISASAHSPPAVDPATGGPGGASHPKPLVTVAAAPTASMARSSSQPDSAPNPRAQQMQARALAAQAAHQQRVSAAAAAHVINPRLSQPSPFTSIRSIPNNAGGDVRSFGGARPENKRPLPNSPLTSLVDASDTTPTPALAYPSLNNSSADNAEIVESRLAPHLPRSRASTEASHPPEPVRFTSPTAPVDISAFLPAPGPPVLIANEATIAASAVPLSDWAAELLWLMGSRKYNPADVASGRWIQSVLAARHSLRSDAIQLDSFKAFVNQTLSATLASPQGLVLGIYFVSRLPIGVLQSVAKLSADAPSSVHALFASMSPVFSWSPSELSFRQNLYGSADSHFGSSTQLTAQLVFVLSLMLSNKWLEDNTFTTKTWHDVTGLPQSQLKDLETSALHLFNFSLFVNDRQWSDFLNLLRTYTSSLVAKEPIGETSSVSRFALGRIDELLVNAQEAKAPSMHQKQSEPNSEREILAMSRASLVLRDEDKDALSRDTAMTVSHRQERHCRSASFPTLPLTTPQWEMLLDSPLARSRHHVQYEAVQRPFDQYGVPPYTATAIRPPVQDPTAYMHAMGAHKQPFGPQPHHLPYTRPWHPSQAPSTFNAPHPSHLNMSRPDVHASSHRYLDSSVLPYPPSQHMGLFQPNHSYASQLFLNGQTHCGRPLDLAEPGWVSQLGYAAQAFVSGSGARIRT